VDRYPLMGEREEGAWIYVSWLFNSSTPGWGVDHFDSVQDGVDAAPEEGTVLVLEGSYVESVLVNKRIRIVGMGANVTIVDGAYTLPAFQITADGVELMSIGAQHSIVGGFLVQGAADCTISHCGAIQCDPGIEATQTTGLHVADFDPDMCDWDVVVSDSAQAVLTDIVSDGGLGGIRLENSTESLVTSNVLTNPGWCNIQLDGCSDVLVAANELANGTIGIELLSAVGCTITRNTLDGHYTGVSADAGAMGNLLYANSFTNGVGMYYASDLGANAWDNGLPAGGNFWDDYTGVDTDGDGFGEQPYSISPGINFDYHPVTTAVGPNPPEVWVDLTFDFTTPGWGFDHFAVIQDGVDGVAEQGVVHVANGTYAESVVVSKPLLLEGESRTDTILYGGGTIQKIVNILAEGVTVRTLRIVDGSSGWGAGVYVAANHATVENCHIRLCNDGVWMNNKQHTTVLDCELQNNSSGIDMIYSSYGLFVGNDFSNNSFGLEMRSSSSNNAAYENNFTGNSSWNATSSSGNAWDDGSRGNYWDDYTGSDDDGDGIGDQPYHTRGQGRDGYPLMSPN